MRILQKHRISALLLRDSPLRHALLAILTGLGAGFGAVVFRDLIALFHNLFFFGQFSIHYDANVHTRPSPWGALIIAMPIVGAGLVAFLVKNFAPEAKGHGVPEVMDAIHYNNGIIRPVVGIVKSVASGISIGSGGSIGREGPIIQIGAVLGSVFGQFLRLPEWQRVTLVACGVGGGIAATFNTPIGGLLFATEIVMTEISARTLIPVAIATGAATFVGRAFFGVQPSFLIPTLALPAAHQTPTAVLGAYVLLGLVLGLVSVVYIRSIYGFEDLFEQIPGNYYTRHMLGMGLVGLIMYLFVKHTGLYYVEGVGYATIQNVLSGQLIDPYFLLLLFAAKLLATSLTLGSGGSGGIFSPSLYLGSTLGYTLVLVMNHLFPMLHLDPSSAAVIGMAGIFGAATGAVVTSIVMTFEMTRDYNVIVPLMIAVSIAYGVRQLLLSDSIYTMKLTRRGRIIPSAMHSHLSIMRPISNLTSRPVLCFDYGKTFADLEGHRTLDNKLPDVLIVENEQIRFVLPATHAARLSVTQDRSLSLEQFGTRSFVVVHPKEILFDVIARLRDSNSRIALIAKRHDPLRCEDVLGLITWEDILGESNLPSHLLRRE